MSRVVILAGFAVLIGAGVALEARARLGPAPGASRATLGDLVDGAVRRPAGRLLAILAWLWAGWHLFVR